MKKEKSNLQNLIELMPEKKFLFYKLNDNEKLEEHPEKFKTNSVLVQFNEKIKSVEEISLSGLYISALEDEYSSIIDMDKEVDLIIDLPNKTIKNKVEVLTVDFIQKKGSLYKFYLSLNSGVIKKLIEENIDDIVELKKIEILRLAELDEL